VIWASAWDGRERRPLRLGLAIIVGLSQAVEAFQVGWQSQDAARYPPTGALSTVLARVPGAAWFLLLGILIGLWGVARDRRPVASAVGVLVLAAVLSEWQTEIFGSPSRNAFFPGAALLGWTLGQVWALNVRPKADLELRERLAEAGALGCLAAAYVGSATSKLLTTGLAWADGAQVRALVLQQQPLSDWAWLTAYRNAVIETPELAIAASIATLVIEGGALLLLFGPRLRAVWALLLIGLHVNITMLATMPYVGATLLLALFGLPWPGLRTNVGPRRDEGPTLPLPMAVLLGCLVVAAWSLQSLGWRATH